MVGVFILIGVMFYERNRLFFRLKNQQAKQIKFYSNEIDRQQKKSLSGMKTKEEKQKILKKFRETKKKILDGIKKEHIKQKKEFERIRREKGKGDVEEKIADWKRSVYSNVIKRAEFGMGLKIKLGILERAYDEGYISKETYSKVKGRIKKLIKN